MRRFFFEDKIVIDQPVKIEADLFHHIFEVCRIQVEGHFELISPEGKAFLVQVIHVGKNQALVNPKEVRDLPKPKAPLIHLVMSVPRYPVFEATLEKAVELGVSSIHFAYSDYSQVKSDKMFAFGKWDRWKRIIISSTQQTGRGDLLVLNKPENIFEIVKKINQNQGGSGLFAYEGEEGTPIRDYLQLLKVKNPKEIWVFAGGEGGFSTQEVESFKNLDLQPVTLGSQILRVETACVTLVSALKYEFDLLR